MTNIITSVHSSRSRTIAYWITTAILVFAVLGGGLGELTNMWGTLETVTILGYPPYFLTILGAWKVLGSIALLVPGFPRLKEWAYAGIFFGMTGAAVSHVMRGDYGAYAFHLIVTLSLAGLAVASWALRPQSRQMIVSQQSLGEDDIRGGATFGPGTTPDFSRSRPYGR